MPVFWHFKFFYNLLVMILPWIVRLLNLISFLLLVYDLMVLVLPLDIVSILCDSHIASKSVSPTAEQKKEISK